MSRGENLKKKKIEKKYFKCFLHYMNESVSVSVCDVQITVILYDAYTLDVHKIFSN